MTCAWCDKKIKGAENSHGICPECAAHLREKMLADYGPAIRREIETARVERRAA